MRQIQDDVIEILYFTLFTCSAIKLLLKLLFFPSKQVIDQYQENCIMTMDSRTQYYIKFCVYKIENKTDSDFEKQN